MADNLGDILGQSKTIQDDTTEQLGVVDASTYFENPIENILANIINIKMDTVAVGSGFIFGNQPNATLGTQTLGVGSNLLRVRIIESKHYFDITEEFTSTTYFDSVNSTGSGWGTGSYVFMQNSSFSFVNGSPFTVSASAGSIVFG